MRTVLQLLRSAVVVVMLKAALGLGWVVRAELALQNFAGYLVQGGFSQVAEDIAPYIAPVQSHS